MPNILYILADDLGYGDLTSLNPASGVQTPNIDRLSHEGMTFTDAHSPSAVCSPTRYGILTGQYCFRTRLKSGVLTGYSPSLIKPETITVAELLKEAGYVTACIGKWHLGLDWSRKDTALPLLAGDGWTYSPTDNVDYGAFVAGGPRNHGFDYSFIIPASLDIIPYVYIENGFVAGEVNDTTGGRSNPRGVFWRAGDIQEGFLIEDVLNKITDKALEFIHENSNPDIPYFLYLPLTAPHTPWLPGKEFQGTSTAGIYGDFVANVDACIGKILDEIDLLGQTHNTLVFFTSDNGAHWTPQDQSLFDHRANYIFRGMKSDAWEGGHHIPLLVRWPKHIEAGSTSAEITCLTDLWRTCAELTGFERSENQAQDSYSILPVLLNAPFNSPIRDFTIHHSINGIFAIRKGAWKLIDDPGSGGWSYQGSGQDPPQQLYNLMNDPSETTNLLDQYPEVSRELTDLLNENK